jgi:hypothetical protein
MASLKIQGNIANINLQKLANNFGNQSKHILSLLNSGLANAGNITRNYIEKTIPVIANVSKNTSRSLNTFIQKGNLMLSSTATDLSEKISFLSKQAYKRTANATGSARTVLAEVGKIITDRTNLATHKIGDFIAISNQYWFGTEQTKILSVDIQKVSSTSAIITWKTNDLADSAVNYGVDTSYGERAQSSDKVKDHKIELTNLSPDKTYFFEVMSQGKNYVHDSYYTFTTQKDGNSTQVELLKKPNVEIIGNSGDTVIIRNSPTKSGGIIGKAIVGQKFQLLMQKYGWNLVKYKETEGWVSGEFSKLTE